MNYINVTLTRRKFNTLTECFSESTTACLVTMVQGNILSLTLIHFSVAAQTGLFASLSTSLMLYMTKLRSKWSIALLLGIFTAIVDFLVHPGSFGSVITEAVVTGIGAALLSLIFRFILDFFLRAKKIQADKLSH